MNVVERIREETGGLREKAALIEGDTSVSYETLLFCIDTIAGELKKKGVARFSRVGLLCGDSIDYVMTNLAVLSLGAVIVPISPDQSLPEVEEILEKISVDFLIFEKGTCGEEASESFSPSVLINKQLMIRKRSLPELPVPEYYNINPAFIRFSSGTTGASKGVVLSHESIIERTDAADAALKITSSDIVLWVLSMSFHFVVTILLFLRRGATIVLCGSAFPESLIRGIVERKGTFIYASPFHYNLLTRSDLLSGTALGNIRLAITTAMKLPESVADGFSEKFGFELAEAYGIIEVGLPFVRLASEGNGRSSVGRPLPAYEIRLEHKDAEGVGEIFIKGPGMLDAYFSPWQSRSEVLKDGWFRTGDLGRIDDGRLTIVGREKDVINFAGMKIFPHEVESVLNEYPRVKESMVYGVPHPYYGQLPAAKVVLQDGAGFDIAELRRFCYRTMAQYKVPKEFTIVDALPKTASGKVKRENTSR